MLGLLAVFAAIFTAQAGAVIGLRKLQDDYDQRIRDECGCEHEPPPRDNDGSDYLMG